MKAKGRAGLLRERFKTLFPVAATPHPEPKRKRTERETPAKWRSSVFGVALHEADRRKKWIVETAPVVAPVPAPKRRNGVPVLVKIAAQAPKKLKRRHASAEAMLVGRPCRLTT